MIIKVCGLREKANVLAIDTLSIDLMGMIFYEKSPRFVEGNTENIGDIPITNTPKVGVFVNEKSYSIFNHIAHYDLDLVQLHGDETVDVCGELKTHVKVIKAFQINDDFDFKNLEKYLSVVDYFLFDSTAVNYGGSGQSFNWEVLKKYNYTIPFFLSGGINEEHIDEIKKLTLPQLTAIDINSKFETEPGLKNTEQISKFILKLNDNGNK